MKMPICILTIVLISGLTLSQDLVRSAYPRATITPSRIVYGDTVRLSLTLAQGSSSCVPTYSKISYTIEKQPQGTSSPNFNLYLSYEEIPPKSGGSCLTVMTDYGPQFTFAGLDEGSYTCIDKNNSTVAAFRVLKNDSIYYEVSTLKTLYSKGQQLDVTYKVKNNSTHTVRYEFPSSCKFDMTLMNSAGQSIYHYKNEMVCGGVLTELSLQPGEETLFEFPVFALKEMYGQLTISAQLIGYEASAVSKKIIVNQTTSVGWNHETVPSIRKCTWNPLSKTLIIEIEKEEHVSLKLYSSNGKNVQCVFTSKTLKAGSHTISLFNQHSAHGVFFVRFEGEHISQTIKLLKL